MPGRALVIDDVVLIAAGIARRALGVDKAGSPSRAPSSISTSWNGRTSRSGATTGWRIESAGPSTPPIGRSSSEMQSQRSR